jgi:hypothetical protein
MPGVGSDRKACGSERSRRWSNRLTRAALAACLAGPFLLSGGAWAAGPNVQAGVAAPGDASVMLINATAISDTEMASQVARGAPGPTSAIEQSIQQPRVILWDEIGQQTLPSTLANAPIGMTLTVGH